MEAIDCGWLSILPPIIAIVLALLTKEVISSLIIGILAGGLIYTGFNVVGAVDVTFNVMAEKMGGNSFILLFLALLGALVVGVTKAGGSRAYGQWAVTIDTINDKRNVIAHEHGRDKVVRVAKEIGNDTGSDA